MPELRPSVQHAAKRITDNGANQCADLRRQRYVRGKTHADPSRQPTTAPMPASSHRFMFPIRSVALKVLYFHRLRGVGRVEAEDPRVEVKFSAQRLLDGLRAAE